MGTHSAPPTHSVFAVTINLPTKPIQTLSSRLHLPVPQPASDLFLEQPVSIIPKSLLQMSQQIPDYTKYLPHRHTTSLRTSQHPHWCPHITYCPSSSRSNTILTPRYTPRNTFRTLSYPSLERPVVVNPINAASRDISRRSSQEINKLTLPQVGEHLSDSLLRRMRNHANPH